MYSRTVLSLDMLRRNFLQILQSITTLSIPAQTLVEVPDVSADRRKQPQQPAVVDMAWGSSARDALLVLLQPATLVIVNAQTGAIVRTLTIAQGQVVTSLLVDEWDPAVFATTTMSNSLLTCRIDDPQPEQGHQPVVPFTNAQLATNLHNLPIQGVLLKLSGILDGASRAAFCRVFGNAVCDHCRFVGQTESAGIVPFPQSAMPASLAVLSWYKQPAVRHATI